jgi:hypothetical protein
VKDKTKLKEKLVQKSDVSSDPRIYLSSAHMSNTELSIVLEDLFHNNGFNSRESILNFGNSLRNYLGLCLFGT